VDDARRIKRDLYLAPLSGDKKMYIFDECHRMSGAAFDSLLKDLEEPPKHVVFAFCTTELPKVPITIKSRAKGYQVKPLNSRESEDLIYWIIDNEKIKLAGEVIDAIIEKCEGIPREIATTIDKIRDIKDSQKAIDLIYSAEGDAAVIDLCRALIDGKKKWGDIAKILREIKDEPESVRYAVLGYMNAILMKGDNKRAAEIILTFNESIMYSKKAGLTGLCYLVVNGIK
jgi:DNA polymerase III gamma/tau subunit